MNLKKNCLMTLGLCYASTAWSAKTLVITSDPGDLSSVMQSIQSPAAEEPAQDLETMRLSHEQLFAEDGTFRGWDTLLKGENGYPLHDDVFMSPPFFGDLVGFLKAAKDGVRNGIIVEAPLATSIASEVFENAEARSISDDVFEHTIIVVPPPKQRTGRHTRLPHSFFKTFGPQHPIYFG